MSRVRFLTFITSYYAVWFGCLNLAKLHQPFFALLLSIVISAFQIMLLPKSQFEKYIALWLVIFSGTGFVIDSLFIYFDVLKFNHNSWNAGIAPPWILALWINFAVLNIGIRGLLNKIKPYLGLIAFFGFPLAYQAGSYYGEAQFSDFPISYVIMGIVWSIVFPILIHSMPNPQIKG